MDDVQRQALIERYKDGPRVVREALANINEAELDARPSDGWSAREVVHHLADSETTSGIRLRRLLAENAPTIEGYDEAEFARWLYYDRPIQTSLEVLDVVRRASAEILERLAEAEWVRAGRHTESGPYSVEDWLEIYAAHAHDHADQIRRARAAASS
jgi:hypothetical protein